MQHLNDRSQDAMDAMDRKVLRRAAELVDRGWCQMALGQAGHASLSRVTQALLGSDRLCAVGAISVAIHEVLGVRLPTDEIADDPASPEPYARPLDPFWPIRDRLVWSCQKAMDGPMSTLDAWNDTEGRTADQVADLLRRASTLTGGLW